MRDNSICVASIPKLLSLWYWRVLFASNILEHLSFSSPVLYIASIRFSKSASAAGYFPLLDGFLSVILVALTSTDCVRYLGTFSFPISSFFHRFVWSSVAPQLPDPFWTIVCRQRESRCHWCDGASDVTVWVSMVGNWWRRQLRLLTVTTCVTTVAVGRRPLQRARATSSLSSTKLVSLTQSCYYFVIIIIILIICCWVVFVMVVDTFIIVVLVVLISHWMVVLILLTQVQLGSQVDHMSD